jgi:hypothetical protein
MLLAFGFHDRFHHLLSATIQDGDHYRFHACLSLKVKCHSPADLPTLLPASSFYLLEAGRSFIMH